MFWEIKGGGGDRLGVVTSVTLRTFDLPAYFGGTFVTGKATSDVTFRKLIWRIVQFYSDNLNNSHRVEQIAFKPDNSAAISMVFQAAGSAASARSMAPVF